MSLTLPDDRCSAHDRDGLSPSEADVAGQRLTALWDKLATIYGDEVHALFSCGRHTAAAEFRDMLEERGALLAHVPEEVARTF